MASFRKQLSLLTVLLLNIFCSFVASLYFHIEDTEKKCFIQELPEDTMVVGNFQTHLYDNKRDNYLPANQDRRMFIEAKGPDDKLLLSKQYDSEGRFYFRSYDPGRHQICLQSSSSQRPLSAGDMLMIHLDIRVGERSNNYTEIAATDKLTELQLRVRQLAEQVEQILKELAYQRIREEHFRQIDHSTNMWIFWWPVVRSLYVVAIILWSTNSW